MPPLALPWQPLTGCRERPGWRRSLKPMQQDDNGVKLARLNRASPPAQGKLVGGEGLSNCHCLGLTDEGAGEE